MYEPTEREISLAMCKTLNKIDEKLTWILAAILGGLVAMYFRS